MDKESRDDDLTEFESTEESLSRVQELVPIALSKAKQVKGFAVKWMMIISKLEQIPSLLSDLSTHPCFSKSNLCIEQLQAISKTMNETIELGKICVEEKYEGKLRMKSDLDCLLGKLDLNLHDCGLLIKTGVLGDISISKEHMISISTTIRELFARLQIGNLEAKQTALDSLFEIMNEDRKNVLNVLGRSNIAALVQLLTASHPKIREKSISMIYSISDSGCFENWLISENVIPPLIRVLESGNSLSKEKAILTLKRLSLSAETARLIIEHGGARSLIDLCKNGDSVSQASAACTLRNLSNVPDVRQNLSDEGIVSTMIDLLDRGITSRSKEHGAECLQNLSSGNENLRRDIISQGGIRSLLSYLDRPFPQESPMGALRNLIGSVSIDVLIPLGIIPRLAHVLRSGSLGAQIAATSAICKICSGGSIDTKKLLGEAGCIPPMIKLLEAKTNDAREVASRVISSLMMISNNRREVKRDEKSVPNLVQLLDPNPRNASKKYAICCLLVLSSSKKCRKMMIAYGAIGYLKKLCEMEISGTKKLLERLEKGKLRSLFIRK